MDDKLKDRFKEIENKHKNQVKVAEINFNKDLKHPQKRVDDIPLFPTLIVLALTVIIIGFGLFSAFSPTTEIENLKQFKTETQNEIDSTRNELKTEIEDSLFSKPKKSDPDVVSNSASVDGRTASGDLPP